MGLLLTVAANHTTDESGVDGLSISLLLHQLQNTVGHLHTCTKYIHTVWMLLLCTIIIYVRCCKSIHHDIVVVTCVCMSLKRQSFHVSSAS